MSTATVSPTMMGMTGRDSKTPSMSPWAWEPDRCSSWAKTSRIPKAAASGIHKGLETKYGLRSGPLHPDLESRRSWVLQIGAAIAGMRPVAEIMLMNFISVAADQLFNHAAKLRYMSGGVTPVPLTVRTTTGAGAGFEPQDLRHARSALIHTPGLKVVVPRRPPPMPKGLLLSCIFDNDPCVFIEMNSLYFTARDEVPHR